MLFKKRDGLYRDTEKIEDLRIRKRKRRFDSNLHYKGGSRSIWVQVLDPI